MAYDEPLHGGFCRVEPRSHPPDAKIFRDISEGKSFDDPWTPYTLSWKDACQLVWSSEPELNGPHTTCGRLGLAIASRRTRTLEGGDVVHPTTRLRRG